MHEKHIYMVSKVKKDDKSDFKTDLNLSLPIRIFSSKAPQII